MKKLILGMSFILALLPFAASAQDSVSAEVLLAAELAGVTYADANGNIDVQALVNAGFANTDGSATDLVARTVASANAISLNNAISAVTGVLRSNLASPTDRNAAATALAQFAANNNGSYTIQQATTAVAAGGIFITAPATGGAGGPAVTGGATPPAPPSIPSTPYVG